MPPRRPKKTAPVIVKRPSEERKKLPPELEAFARSQDEKLRLPRRQESPGRLRDPREGYTIAGVSNRDARAVYDARVAAMRGLWADGGGDEAALAELAELLHDAQRLALWRARRVTGFEAFVEQVLGIPTARARSLVAAHAAQCGESEAELSERSVALWLRTEAGLFEGDGGARARIREAADGPRLELSLRLSGASAGLAGVGARHVPLAREQAEAGAARAGGPVRAEGSVKLLTRQHGEAGAPVEPEAMAEPAPSEPPEAPRFEAGERPLRKRPPSAPREAAGFRSDSPPQRGRGRGFGERREAHDRSEFAGERGFDKPARFAREPGRAGGFAGGSEGGFGNKRPFAKKPHFARDRPEQEEGRFREGRGFGTKRPFAGQRSGGERGFRARDEDAQRAGAGPRFSNARGDAKPRFGARGDAKPRFSNARGDAKPRFSNARGDAKPRFSNARGDAKPRFSNARGDAKPRFSNARGDAKPRFRDGARGDTKPRFGGAQSASFGGERKKPFVGGFVKGKGEKAKRPKQQGEPGGKKRAKDAAAPAARRRDDDQGED